MTFELDPGLIPVDYDEGILSLDMAKAHLRVLDDDEDDLIAALRGAAIDMVERYTGLFLGRREAIVWTGDGFGARMTLGRGPKPSVIAFAYTALAGSTVLAADRYRVSAHGLIVPAHGLVWPTDGTGAVTITFDAGFTDVAREAPSLVTAVKLMLGTLFVNRESVVTGVSAIEMPMGFKAMCDLHRMPVI